MDSLKLLIVISLVTFTKQKLKAFKRVESILAELSLALRWALKSIFLSLCDGLTQTNSIFYEEHGLQQEVLNSTYSSLTKLLRSCHVSS